MPSSPSRALSAIASHLRGGADADGSKVCSAPAAASGSAPTAFFAGGIGLGCGALGRTDVDALSSVAGAWEAGTRYYDTAPWYGKGLSEQRLGLGLVSAAALPFARAF